MKIYDILSRSKRNLSQARARTILTSLAIAVGTFTVTLALAAGAGGRQYTDDMIKTSGDAQSLSVYAKAPSADKKELKEYGATDNASNSAVGYLNKKDVKKIQAISGVARITPAVNIQANYATRGQDSKKYIIPIDIKVDRTDVKLAAGSLADKMVPDSGITLPQQFLSSFGFADAKSAIGKTITVNFPRLSSDNADANESMNKTFKIVAVDYKADTSLYYQPILMISINDGKVISDYQTGNKANEKYSQLVVETKTKDDVTAVEKVIAKDYDVYSLEDARSQLLELVNIAQWGMVAFGALAILASIFGIINTQYISVLERTQQIGLMKALGMRKKDIAKLFKYEAAWVGLLGGVIGTIAALSVGFFNPLIAQTLKLEKGVELLVFDPLTSFILILLMIIVAVLSGYFPSRKAAKLDPIEALRTE